MVPAAVKQIEKTQVLPQCPPTRLRRRQHIHAPQPHFLQTALCLQAVCVRNGPLRRAGMSIKNIALDNAPSHACRLACDYHKTLLHGTVEFQPPYSPDLSPLDFFLAQSAARSASFSCQSFRTAGTFDPRVSQNVDRQSLDVRENGQGLGPQAGGLRCRPWDFSSSTEMADRIMPLKRNNDIFRPALDARNFDLPFSLCFSHPDSIFPGFPV